MSGTGSPQPTLLYLCECALLEILKRSMDLSKFSDSDFEVKEWVNGALRAHKDAQTPVDVSLPPFSLV